jgi:hypothetical protein
LQYVATADRPTQPTQPTQPTTDDNADSLSLAFIDSSPDCDSKQKRIILANAIDLIKSYEEKIKSLQVSIETIDRKLTFDQELFYLDLYLDLERVGDGLDRTFNLLTDRWSCWLQRKVKLWSLSMIPRQLFKHNRRRW